MKINKKQNKSYKQTHQQQDYYQQSIDMVFKELETDKDWLNTTEVENRIWKHGKNELKSSWKVSPWKIFFNQFKSALIIILIVATIISAVIWEVVDASVILIIVVLNSIFWFFQEYKAEKAIESLKKMMNPHTTVIREWKKISILSSELTIGDILVLDEWDKISADARLIETINLEIAEAALTGESLPVQKIINKISKESVLWDQKNMVFSGTLVTKWRWKAIVTNIWMKTEIGKIAKMIQSTPQKQTNLQKKLEKLSKWLWISILVICLFIFLAYYYINHLWLSASFLTAVALAVAAIPEGLPAVVTISLWLWVKRMANKHALMRKLSSVETLGAVDIICTDKTGTLTKNEMTVKKLFVNNKVVDISGSGYHRDGKFSEDPKNFIKLLEIWMLCNNSEFQDDTVIWDPTEACLLVSAEKARLNRKSLEKDFVWKDEIPFDSVRKMMSTIRTHKGKTLLYTKWAPEELLQKCDRILIDGKIVKLTDKKKNLIEKNNVKFADNALRILWFAYKEIPVDYKIENLEKDMIFVWLQAMMDPPRLEVKSSIQECREAWIRVIMITWDNIITAKAIAKELGIKWDAILWLDLNKKTDKELSKLLNKTSIFARVNPEHKQRIVTILKSKWHVVAMTWDWVNDAPALKQADIWVAMWITWTDVSKEAADMILTDDNFATIVNAVEEWRWIFDNIKKFVNFLLSTNFGEIIIIFAISLMWLPLPLIAIQILWINLVTDGLPALALGIDPIDKNIMKRKPRPADQWIISKDMIWNIIIIAVLMTAWASFIFIRHHETNLEQARTGVFVLMVLMEMTRVQIIRSKYWLSLFTNKWLLWAVSLSFVLVLAVIYTPLSTIFKTSPPSISMWIEILAITIVVTILGFISSKFLWKYFQRK